MEWRLEKLVKEKERNRDCYSELIHLCGKVSNIQIAMRVFTLMENQSIKPTSAVFNALISACLSSGNVITALSLFETMQSSEDCKPDSNTYTTFISGFANLGNDKTMLAWYRAKMAAGFSADIQTYEALIKGFIKSKNCCDATRFYEEMIVAEVVPNASILHSMLEGFCELRSLERVKEFLKFILENGWEINGHMAGKLVGFYYELGTVEEMEELLETLTKTNQDLEVLSRVHNGVIKMYARLDRLDDVEYSVGRLLRQGMFFGCADDVEKVISSYFRRAAYDRLDLFLECIKVSCTLPRSTYDLLIAGYRRAGLYEKVEMMVKDMNVAGLWSL